MASGASLIGIGSDIAGSLRLPAHCCGVWGHKPSPRVVSCTGHYPDCKNRDEWDKVFTLGPMARYAADLKLLLSVIAEPGSKPELKLGETVRRII
jgi:fatty acid amide hydrolase 2